MKWIQFIFIFVSTPYFLHFFASFFFLWCEFKRLFKHLDVSYTIWIFEMSLTTHDTHLTQMTYTTQAGNAENSLFFLRHRCSAADAMDYVSAAVSWILLTFLLHQRQETFTHNEDLKDSSSSLFCCVVLGVKNGKFIFLRWYFLATFGVALIKSLSFNILLNKN